ncbi:MAG: tyrosine-type recombinase/integrase [Cellulosilyticaceae bacterium]
MQLEKAVNIFITALKHEQLSLHTIKAYRQDLEQWQRLMAKQELDELTFVDFQDYLVAIQSMALKVSSIKRKRVVLHRFLKFCFAKQLCTVELHQYIDPIKIKKDTKPKEVLTEEELKCIFDYINEVREEYDRLRFNSAHYEYLYYCAVRNKLLVSVLLYTGCRAQEAVSIKKTDIRYEQNTLTLLTKGNKYNTVPIHDELKKAMTEYEGYVSRLDEGELRQMLQKSIYLFPSKAHENTHLATRTLHDLMKKLEEIIGRSLHAHIFRHTFASYCIAARMDISTISSLISHSNPSITLSIYTHEIDSMQKQREMSKLKFQIDSV